jgi:outer membrane lipoprotein carrier protein
MRRLAAFALALFVVAGPLAADQAAADLAAALQKKYDTVKDFTADFVHIYRGGVLRKQLTERGTLVVKKPGKMRWDYTSPEPKQFVSDGTKLYSYVPADKQVIVSTVAGADEATTPALFLAGKGNLTRDFTPSLVDTPAEFPKSSRALKLVPKKREADYDWLVLVVDPGTLRLDGLLTVDAQGGTSTFVFSSMKENVGTPDSAFVFRMPRGVDVITDSSPR